MLWVIFCIILAAKERLSRVDQIPYLNSSSAFKLLLWNDKRCFATHVAFLSKCRISNASYLLMTKINSLLNLLSIRPMNLTYLNNYWVKTNLQTICRIINRLKKGLEYYGQPCFATIDNAGFSMGTVRPDLRQSYPASMYQLSPLTSARYFFWGHISSVQISVYIFSEEILTSVNAALIQASFLRAIFFRPNYCLFS